MDTASSSATWKQKRVPRAKALRRDSTDAERQLWKRLCGRGLDGRKFRRQHPVCGYVVDFVCLKERLVIELDGGQHAMQAAQDEARTRLLERQGFRVLRFWNNDVLQNLDGVVVTISQVLRRGAAP